MDNTIKTNPAFVLGLYIPGIAIIKHLANNGINVIGLSYIKDVPGFYLNAVKTYLVPSPITNPTKLTEWLISKARECTSTPVLYNTSDDFVKFLAINKDHLSPYFLFPWESAELSASLSSKLELSRIAKKAGVAIPHTIELSGFNNIDFSQIKYPCIIKPLFANDWRTSTLKEMVGSSKVINIENQNELKTWVNKFDSVDSKVLIQELIPGDDSDLFYCVVYRARDQQIKRFFCGQKIRITPIHFGSASYVVTTDAIPFLSIIEKLLDSVDYVGPAGIEFKKDLRDGSYKLIEVNSRFGLWDDLSIDMGSDVFLGYYEDMTDQNPTQLKPSHKKVKWLSFSRDIPDFIQYIREGKITFFGWLVSIYPPIKIAECYKGEFRLLLFFVFGKIIRKLRKLVNV